LLAKLRSCCKSSCCDAAPSCGCEPAVAAAAPACGCEPTCGA
jgi:hypothetical protein